MAVKSSASFFLLIPTILSASSVTLSSSANPSVFGHAVTLTARVSPSAATGAVTFYDGTTVLETKPVVGGRTTFTTTQLAAGVRSLTAFYGGDANDAASSSAILAQKVGAVRGNGFLGAVSYNVGTNPTSVALADFNGDGYPDMAVANNTGSTVAGEVSVLLGNGDGTFQAALNYAAGSSPYSVAIADFNGDGKPDLAVANLGDASYTAGSISILLGNGDGTFQPQVNYSAGFNPGYVVVADFNGDGKADLAVASNVSTGSLCILIGNGDGTFQAPLTYGTFFPSSLAVGDFNGDGKADLAMSNASGVASASNLTIVLGNGNGTFQAPVNYGDAGTEPDFVAVGDFNNDGKEDLAVGSIDGVSILLGNGDGSFQTGVFYASGTQPTSIAVSDFNGDGLPDLAISNYNFSTGGSVDVLLGNGDGTFQAPASYTAGAGPFSIAVGDFNGDGRADVTAADRAGNDVSILIGTPFGVTTTALTSSPNPSTFSQSVTLTATVSPATATGTVTFSHGSVILGTGAVTGGIATFATATLSVGSHAVAATYGGDANDASSTSPAITQTVDKASTTTTLTSATNPSTFGQSVTLKATISSPKATGTVTFRSGLTKLGTAALTGGAAILSVTTLAEGSDSLTATFGGDADLMNSTSPTVTQVVRVPTNTVLSSAPNPSALNQTVMLTATVTPATATGTVTFLHGSTVLGTGFLTNGIATFSTAALSEGTHLLTAGYGGNTVDGPSLSAAITQEVQ